MSLFKVFFFCKMVWKMVLLSYAVCWQSGGLIKYFMNCHKYTVKLDFKELLIKEQIDFKELFTDYQLFYTINLLLNKELLLI